MNQLFLALVMLCHIFVVLFVIITPFTNYNYFLILHAVAVPFIMIHWILNDNTCMLTTVEKHIRTKINGESPDSNDCFTCRIINPIYDFKSNYEQYSTFIYIITISLWLITMFKLYNKWKSGDISTISDLFKPFA